MKLATGAASENALVLGQTYKESAGHYICYIIKDVDGTKTFGLMEPRAPYNFFIPAGSHTFKVWSALGNFGHSLEADPQFSADAFRERHPDEPGGRPLSRQRMTAR